jgi:hypothetical protein
MKTVIISSACIFGMMGSTSPAIELKDARQYVSQLLTKYGPVPITIVNHGSICHWGCALVSNDQNIKLASLSEKVKSDAFIDQGKERRIQLACGVGMVRERYCEANDTTSTVNRVLGFGQIEISFPGEIKFGAPQFHVLPDEIYIDSVVVQNCTTKTVSGSVSKTLNLSVSAMSSTTITNGISNTIGFNLRVGYDTKVYGNYSAGVSYSETISQSTSHTSGKTKTYSDSTSQTVQYPGPKSAVGAEFKVYKLTSKVPFSIEAVIDAPLEANQKGFKKLSDIIPEQDRRLSLKGDLTLAGFSKAQANISEIPFDKTECKPGDAVIERPGFTKKVLESRRSNLKTLSTIELKPMN